VRPVYSTLDLALRRIEALKERGIWPAYFPVQFGWSLSYDPDVPASLLDTHGYLKEPW
jgi:hypothetical protein